MGLGAGLLLAGAQPVGHDPGPMPSALPVFEQEGCGIEPYTSLAQLADRSFAVVVATPTGRTVEVPLPAGYGAPDSAPTVLATLRVDSVVAGRLDAERIDVVSPGSDRVTGRAGLSAGGPYLLFLAPALYGADDPLGAYVAVGVTTGVYASLDGGTTFLRVDPTASALPGRLRAEASDIPAITRTEKELVHAGLR